MDTSYEEIMSALKLVLKSRKLNYRQLSEKIGCSESALKKTFTGKDCSIGKLMNICKVLDIELTDLLDSAKDLEVKKVRYLSEEQENFFVKNFDYFQVFFLLYMERRTVEEIKEKYGLGEKRLFRILRKLDQFDLIELHLEGRVKVPAIGKETWTGNGPLMNHIRKVWTNIAVYDSLDDEGQEGENEYDLGNFYLTPTEFNTLKKEALRLSDEYYLKSIRSLMLGRRDVKPIKFLICLSRGSCISSIQPEI